MLITRKLINEIHKEFLKLLANDDDHHFSICTNCAKWLQENHFEDGHIMGYFIQDNPTSKIAIQDGGHDFLVVKDGDSFFIIDFWAKEIEGIKEAPLFINVTKNKFISKTWYGDSSKWSTLDGIEFPYLLANY